jgi:threonine dehydratase
MTNAPTLEEIRITRRALQSYIASTPLFHWTGPAIASRVAPGTDVLLKLELFQQSGTFKARGALANMLRLSDAQCAKGVTTVSAGNHAIAVAYAAASLGVSAKVVMLASANPARIAAARSYGAEVIIGGDGASSFALAEDIARTEGRALIHPFEGKGVALGTGTLGLELHEQAGPLDAVVIAVGGGGLAGGVSAALRQLQPSCEIYGVEPAGADVMSRSIAAGEALRMPDVRTIADSMAPPMTLPYAFSLCRDHLTDIVTVTDDAMCEAMALLFSDCKLAVEPAGAAATAALLGPLRDRLADKRIAIIVCGANIDIDSFATYMRRGARAG